MNANLLSRARQQAVTNMFSTRLACILAIASLPLSAADVRFPFPRTDGTQDTLVIDRFLKDGRAATINPRVREIAAGVIEVTIPGNAVGEWSFAIADDSPYYGFGERFDRLNHAHTILKNASRDIAGDKGSLTYQPIPFFMSLRGYGLWLDTTSEATFDLNVTEQSRILVTCYGENLRLVLFQGPQFPAILDRFTALVGRQQLPPYWAFAPWKARDYHRNDREVLEDVARYRKLGLPASVLLIDSPWATNYNTYEFNPRQFADVRAMIDTIHRQGYKLILWHTPWINRETATPYENGFAGKLASGPAANYGEAERLGYFVRRPDGSPYVGKWWKGIGSLIDFTNPDAVKWWQSQLYKVIALGADGFKDDDAEGTFIGDVSFAGGQDPRLMRNRYAVEYNHAVAEALRLHRGSDWVLFQRSGTVGSHNLPLFWGGDNDASFSPDNGLPTVVTAGLNAGMSGISLWISDLGGYNKTARTPNDAELFARWTEYAAFSPGMEVMSGMNLGPWDYGDEALRIFRRYSVLHMSLFPYRYAAAQESSKSGIPMMRSLVLMNQDDRDAREAVAEYYFGPDFLVAPIVAQGTQRQVYLPEGSWIDYWTGKCLEGRQTIVVDAPLDHIPVFVRTGAIIPTIPEDVMTLAPTSDATIHSLDDRRVYEIIPGTNPRSLQDFEGRHLSLDGKSLSLRGAPARVTLRWRFAPPTSVTVNGTTAKLEKNAEGTALEFHHSDTSVVKWQ